MAKVKPELFAVLQDKKIELLLVDLYKKALKQGPSILLHFLPNIFSFLGKGMSWETEKEKFYDDKYVPIHPAQGSFLYMQARALNAKTILEFGTSYGLSTIYLAKAAKDNGGKVITTEYIPEKAEIARQNLEKAGLLDFVEIRIGDARDTLLDLNETLDLVLLDGWPDLVFPIFNLVEPCFKKGTVIAVDDVDGFGPAMTDYLDFVRNPINGYISETIYPKKGLEFTVRVKD